MSSERYDSIWDALADSPQEAENLRLRAQLMRALAEAVNNWGMTQKDAAQRLQLTQPRLNDLLKGKVDKFSLDALVNMLAGANLKIEVEVTARAAA
ncbi:MAG: XRE family transcriptional regulator [Pseudomonas sp.]|uniref:helix-turn-helix domain-containing protein n=1 Tax=Pseudomonas sp. TaxID=306 RepID=UPI0030F17117